MSLARPGRSSERAADRDRARARAQGSARLYRSFLKIVRAAPGRRLLRDSPTGAWLPAAAVAAQIDALAGELARAGLGPGRILLLEAGLRPLSVIAMLAAWKRDAVVLPVEEDLPRDALVEMARRFRPAVSIRGEDAGAAVLETAPRGRARVVPGAAVLRLTSGTTGKPRAIVCTAAQLVADGRAIIRGLGIGPRDVNIAAVPLGHAYGFGNIVMPFVLQGTAVVFVRRPLPGVLAAALALGPRTVLPAVPYLLDLLARHPGIRGGPRVCISAGAPLPRPVAERFRARFGVRILNLYGSSETGGISCDDGAGETPEGCVGRSLPGVRVSVERAGLSALPPGQGRLVVRGPAVAERCLPPDRDLGAGRFRTRDLGWRDASGRIHLAGRLSDLVNVAGRKVNPVEIEGVLAGHPAVAEAAVLPVADALRGSHLEAWIAGDPRTEPQLLRHLVDRFPPHKIPRRFHFLPQLPRTTRGKIDRSRLLEHEVAAGAAVSLAVGLAASPQIDEGRPRCVKVPSERPEETSHRGDRPALPARRPVRGARGGKRR